MEWVVIKGISDYADRTKTTTDEWRPFASVMAASVVANILKNPFVFQDWPHYNATCAKASTTTTTASEAPSHLVHGQNPDGVDFGSVPETHWVLQTAVDDASGQVLLHQIVTKVKQMNMTLKITLLGDEWESSRGGITTINRMLAKHFASHSNVEVSLLVPQGRCNDADKNDAKSQNVCIVEANSRPGYEDEPLEWLSVPPSHHHMDIIVGHGVPLGRQAELIRKKDSGCKWIQFVHTDPEQLGMHKSYNNPISKGEKKQRSQVAICSQADLIVAIGSVLETSISRQVQSHKKSVIKLIPGIFDEFSTVEQALPTLPNFQVLLFGRGDSEDFEVKGFDIVAKALAGLDTEVFKLMFVGAPSGESENISEKFLQHGISKDQLTVRTYKSRKDLGALFHEADLAVMPSRAEGFGLAALEAMSSGLPILVSHQIGFAKALEEVPGGSNCIVNPNDSKEWAKRIVQVQKKQRHIRLEEAKDLRKKYAEKFDWKTQCDQLLKKMELIREDDGQRLDAKGMVRKASSSLHKKTKGRRTSDKLQEDDGQRPDAKGMVRKASSSLHKKTKGRRTSDELQVYPSDADGPEVPDVTDSSEDSDSDDVGTSKGHIASCAPVVKDGTPTNDELEMLAAEIPDLWWKLGRRLQVPEHKLTALSCNYDKRHEFAYQMLLLWTRANAVRASYQVLYDALRHELVGREDLATKFCCV